MTIDEAIKHCDEVAEEKEREAEYRQETQGDMFKFLDDLSKSVGGEGVENDALNECLECASEHRQLAEWLKELERYRNVRRILSQNRIATDSYGEVVLWSDIKRVLEEVNADEDSN